MIDSQPSKQDTNFSSWFFSLFGNPHWPSLKLDEAESYDRKPCWLEWLCGAWFNSTGKSKLENGLAFAAFEFLQPSEVNLTTKRTLTPSYSCSLLIVLSSLKLILLLLLLSILLIIATIIPTYLSEIHFTNNLLSKLSNCNRNPGILSTFEFF